MIEKVENDALSVLYQRFRLRLPSAFQSNVMGRHVKMTGAFEGETRKSAGGLPVAGEHSGQDRVPADEVMIESGQRMHAGHDQYAVGAQ